MTIMTQDTSRWSVSDGPGAQTIMVPTVYDPSELRSDVNGKVPRPHCRAHWARAAGGVR